jgi:hypothetical protein
MAVTAERQMRGHLAQAVQALDERRHSRKKEDKSAHMLDLSTLLPQALMKAMKSILQDVARLSSRPPSCQKKISHA